VHQVARFAFAVCFAACAEPGARNPVTMAAEDFARMAAIAGFKLTQVCRPNGDVVNTIAAGVPPNHDSTTLMAIGRSVAAKHLSAAGVEVVFFDDSARATCTFPLGVSPTTR
jgi:hypothetical protein